MITIRDRNFNVVARSPLLRVIVEYPAGVEHVDFFPNNQIGVEFDDGATTIFDVPDVAAVRAWFKENGCEHLFREH